MLFIFVCNRHRRTELWSHLFKVRYIMFYIAWNVNCAFMDGPVVMNFSIGLGNAERDNITIGRCVQSCNTAPDSIIYDPWCKSHLVLVNVHELLNSQYRERALDIAHSNNGNFLRVLTELYTEKYVVSKKIYIFEFLVPLLSCCNTIEECVSWL